MRNQFNVPPNSLMGRVQSLWRRFPEGFRLPLEESFQPQSIEERLLPGEEPQLQIGLAWYRDIAGIIVFRFSGVLLFLAVVAAVAIFVYTYTIPLISWLWALTPFGIYLLLLLIAIQQRIHYRQYRLLKTNARLIISIPQPGSSFLVDNIELKGLPTVLDTNWSPNPWWRLFQFFTGARDLYISLSAWAFTENKAEVRGALIIPDVEEEDVFELKRLVFPVPSKPSPQKVVFSSPQKVIITEEE